MNKARCMFQVGSLPGLSGNHLLPTGKNRSLCSDKEDIRSLCQNVDSVMSKFFLRSYKGKTFLCT